MNCEAYVWSKGRRCVRRATRPCERPTTGFCDWLCTQHGKGRKTYKLYRPWRGGKAEALLSEGGSR